MCPNLGNYLRGEARSVVVFDNAPVHTHPSIRKMIEDVGARLIMCAPYSPDLNPIEPTFHQYKSYLRRHWFSGVVLGQLHLSALLSISPQNMRNYYSSIGCIRNLPHSEDEADVETETVVCAVVGVVVEAAIIVVRRNRTLLE